MRRKKIRRSGYKPMPRKRFDKALIQVFLGRDNKIYLKSNTFVEPHGRFSFDSVQEFMDFWCEEEGREIAYWIYNHIGLAAVDPDLTDEERGEVALAHLKAGR